MLPWCSIFTQTPCSVPVNVKVTAILSAKLTLTWDASNISNGSKIQVAWAPYPTSNFVFKSFNSGTSGAIDGLLPSTKYTVRVSKICGSGSSSAVLGLGTLRTLSKAEEAALCTPDQSDNLCQALRSIETGERGSTYIDIRFPELPAAALALSPHHNITLTYQPLNQPGLGQIITLPYEHLTNPLRINGLIPNTLYHITGQWEVTDELGQVLNSCRIDLNDTPTMGEDYAGPVFTVRLPSIITLDCSTPQPIELVFPNVSGGCTRPRITFTDQELSTQTCEKRILRTWLAVDRCGRSATSTQTITLVDTEAPVFIDVPANDATIACGENLPTEAPTAVDNCSAVNITSTQQETSLGGCKSTITRTWVATDACGNTVSYVQTIHVEESITEPDDEDDEVPSLPVNCGQPYTTTPITSFLSLSKIKSGDIISIAGFPSKVKNASGGNGVFSGRTKVRLPFGNKVVYCDFTGVHINADKQITQGTLIAVSDPDFVMPEAGAVNFGGAICVPDPPVLEYGFNNQGEYVLQPPYEGWQPGDPIDPNYDPNGFDANGYNRETGTQFNEQGCSQEGLNAQGDPCNPGTQGPYYWLHNNNNSGNNSSSTTPEGIAYATSLEQAMPDIRALVQEALGVLQQANQDALNNQSTTCNGIRTTLNTQVGTLDRKFFFGENDAFFNEDMSLNFTSKPIALQIHVPDRNPQIVAIEDKHIELYYCDKLMYKFKQIKVILTDMQKPFGLDDLVPDILDAIQRLTAAQVVQFQAHPEQLKEWIRTFITDQVNEELQARGIVMVSPATQSYPDYLVEKEVFTAPASLDPGHRFPSASTMLASADEEATMRMIAAQSLDLSPAALRFEYGQGLEYVGGIDRAFYLDAIAKARDRHYAPPGDESESLLPIRIEKEVGGRTYTILLDQITFSPGGGTLNAYFILDVPLTGQKIVFRAEDVPFTPGGLPSTGTKLRLQSDVGIRLNNTAKLIIIGSHNNTYVEWDCNGFKEIGVEAEVEFCRNYLLPLTGQDLQVDPDENKHVKAHFTATMPAWGEFIATITMDKFALTKHPDYKWEILNASIDFSEVANPPNFSNITSNYFSEFGSGNLFSPQWKGFFLEHLRVTLPKRFNKNSSTPISIAVDKLIIDDRGVTGLITVNANILSLNDGNLDGWAYSIDQLSIAVVANKIQGGGFGGKLHIPLFKALQNNGNQVTAADCFDYQAKIFTTPTGEAYEFTVKSPPTPRKVNMMLATATLEPNSSVKVTYVNDVFTILTNLNGSILVNGNVDANTTFKLPALTFQGIQLSNQAPYFRGGTLGISGSLGSNIGGFGIQITLPKLAGNGGNQSEATFSVGAAITLVGDTQKDQGTGLNFGAETTVNLIGELETVNGRQNWKYKDYSIAQISLDASFKGVTKLKGTISWFKENSTYGRGFRGEASLELAAMKKKNSEENAVRPGMQVLVQFGKKDDYKYFFADALLSFKAGEVNVAGLDIRRIGGGVYYHMARDTNAFQGLDQAPDAFILPDGLGVSLSGIVYTPSDAISLGIKFTVVVATPKEEVFNAGVTLEIRFNAPEPPATNTIGGIKDIALYGSAQMMAPIKFGPYTGQPTPAAPVSANLAIYYDFASKTLHGELAVFANVENSFQGAGPNYSVGKAVIHFDPDKWYINIGTPAQPVALKISIPIGNGASINLVEVKSYLCIGTGIPPMPPLPSYVSQMTGATNFLANESRRATGKGFALGASLEINTGDMEFLIFYGHVHAGLGFDLLLQQYEGINCSNNGNKPLGINGWYAAGQAWAFLDAGIGVKWKSHHFDILKIGAAAALQIKLPNPFWARGAVGGEYRILGGLVHGKCNFKFTLGKSCDSGVEDDVTSVKLIDEMNPADEAESVEVNTKPIAYFGVQVNEPFTLYNANGDEIKYRADLYSMKLTKTSDGSLVNIPIEYSPDHGSATLASASFLKGNTDYTFTATVKLFRLENSNSIFIKEETKTTHFTTARAPNVIPPSNVLYSYPVNGMYNFYKTEWNSGSIVLVSGQPELFEDGQEEFQIRFSTKQEGVVASLPVTIEDGAKVIGFSIPDNLANNRTYRMELIKLAEETTSTPSGGGTAARPGGNTPEDFVPKDLTLFTAYFRTSQYNTFLDKLNAFVQHSTTGYQSDQVLYRTAANFEPFDRIELQGIGGVEPLISSGIGHSLFTDSVTIWYKEMEELDFVPRNRIPAEGTLIPEQLLVDPNATYPVANSELYEQGFESASNQTSRLEYRFFKIFNYDFGFFRDDVKSAIIMECSYCSPSSTVAYYPPGSGNQPTCTGNGFNGSTINCANLSVPCCCCSATNSLLDSKRVKYYVYTYSQYPRPQTFDTQHSMYMGYHLPSGRRTSWPTTVYFSSQ